MATFDLIVIGAGSGGLAAAKRAASYGKTVAICESDRVGGTCVIYGCVPKKIMVYASQFAHATSNAKQYGWDINASFSWETLKTNRDQLIDRLNTLHISFLEKSNVTLLTGEAVFNNANSITIEGNTHTAETILIATGGTATPPKIEGANHAVTSNALFSMPSLPESIAIIGGGYIGIEFASILNALGSKVGLILRKNTILRGFDNECRQWLQTELSQSGINILTETEVTQIKIEGSLKKLSLSTGESLSVQETLFAIGRHPNTNTLNLAPIGVKTDSNGAIQVDDSYQTSAPHIFALGDCTNRVNLTPVAIAEGRAFADTQFGNNPQSVSYTNIPTAVFTTPELGTVGLSQEEATNTYGDTDIKVYKTDFKALFHSLTGQTTRTYMKLIVQKSTDKVLGAHMIGDGAGEICQSLAIALQMGATKADFDRTMALHPSSAEEFVTMR
jgi:glutathione reductase (NADPH)